MSAIFNFPETWIVKNSMFANDWEGGAQGMLLYNMGVDMDLKSVSTMEP